MEIAPYHIIIGNATDIGRVREHNEDYMAHFDTMLGYCIIVCDGMGGHAAGEVAALNTVEAVRHFLQNGKVTRPNVVLSLRNALEFANFKLREMVQENPALKGMGTTCVTAIINHSDLYIAHAGDSRLYLIRGKEIVQLTKDHSAVQNLIDLGALTEEEAEKSDKRNQITKAVGVFEKLDPTITPEAIPLQYGDKILLCSDGLTTHVSKKEILEVVLKNPDVQSAALQLVDMANQAGGTDNITVQIVHYKGQSSAALKKTGFKKYGILGAVIFTLTVLLVVVLWKIIPALREKPVVTNTPPIKPLVDSGYQKNSISGNQDTLAIHDKSILNR